MATILVVDDRVEHRRLMRRVLERDGHRVVDTADGMQALLLARAEMPDLVLSDILMPGMDGFTLCRRLQADPHLRHMPFVFVTGTFSDEKHREFARQVGASRILNKPFDTQSLRRVVDEVLHDARSDATMRFASLDETSFNEQHVATVNLELAGKVGELEAANERLRDNEARAQAMLDGVVATISKMVEYRDPYTTGHERRVGDLATAIGRMLGMDGPALDGLRIGGYLHDVGKIALPTEILAKPGRLTAVEFSLLKAHSEIGHDILSSIDFPWEVAQMALQHHERLDGSGYPKGLRGDDILREARILAVADTVEAMTSHRPYRPAIGLEKALEEVERGRGRLYDADAVDTCLRLFREERYCFD
jgi:putative two-component system response regulator